MSSQIDATKPVTGSATTASVRSNFSQLITEIKQLQGEIGLWVLSASVAANALTVALKDATGADATATTGVEITFRNDTATNGVRVSREVTTALSLVVPQGATLGFTASETNRLYVYALDNAGTVELAISMTKVEEGEQITTTAMTTASDVATVMYSTTARSSVPVRLLGIVKIQHGGTLGNWSNAPGRVDSNTCQHLSDGANVRITGGLITGITDLAIADGGTGASDAATARSNLGIFLNKEFESAEQTVTSAGSLTIPHGLGAVPKLIDAHLICKTASAGYSVGDRITIAYATHNQSSNGGMTVQFGNTNLLVRFGSDTNVFPILHKTTGVATLVANGNFNLVLKAWA